MQLTTFPEKRVDTVVAINAKRPLHAFLYAANPAYTYDHAHRFESFKGVTGPLPQQLKLSREFITTVLKEISPAEENWGDRRTHVLNKNSPYQSAYAMYIEGFNNLVSLAEDCIAFLLDDFKGKIWPYTMSRADFEGILSDLDDLQQRQKSDKDTAYINLPWVILVAYDMLLRVDALFIEDWITEEMSKFKPYLAFPVVSPLSYNLNVCYTFDYAAPLSNSKPHSFVCGYCLGRVSRGEKRGGKKVGAIRLGKVTITTVHSKKFNSEKMHPGFFSILDFT